MLLHLLKAFGYQGESQGKEFYFAFLFKSGVVEFDEHEACCYSFPVFYEDDVIKLEFGF